MNTLKVIISFIIISYVVTINVAIASTFEQEVSNIEEQQIETKNKTNKEETNKNNSTSIATIVGAAVGALATIIGALVMGAINCHLEKNRQKHAEKMQEKRNEQELLLLSEKNKQEQKIIFLNKKLDIYDNAKIELKNYLINGQIENYIFIAWIHSIYIYGNSETKKAIDEYNTFLQENNLLNEFMTLKIQAVNQNISQTEKLQLIEKVLTISNKCVPFLNKIDDCIRNEIQEISNELKK